MNFNKLILAAFAAMSATRTTEGPVVARRGVNRDISRSNMTDTLITQADALMQNASLPTLKEGWVSPSVSTNQTVENAHIEERTKWQQEAIDVVHNTQLNTPAAKDNLAKPEGNDIKLALEQLANARFNNAITNPENKAVLSKGLTEFIRLNINNLDVNEPIAGLKGSSLLHVAVILSDKDLVEKLISRGANLNSVGENGFSPIKIAALENNVEIGAILAFNGANTESLENVSTKDVIKPRYKVTDNCGEPLERNQQAIRAYGRVYDAFVHNKPLPKSRKLTDFSAFKNREPTYHDPFIAIMNNDYTTLKILIARDHSILERTDDHGRGLLDYAALLEKPQVAELLLQAGIQPKLIFDDPSRAVGPAGHLTQVKLKNHKQFIATYAAIVKKVKEANEAVCDFSKIIQEYKNFVRTKQASAPTQTPQAIKSQNQFISGRSYNLRGSSNVHEDSNVMTEVGTYARGYVGTKPEPRVGLYERQNVVISRRSYSKPGPRRRPPPPPTPDNSILKDAQQQEVRVDAELLPAELKKIVTASPKELAEMAGLNKTREYIKIDQNITDFDSIKGVKEIRTTLDFANKQDNSTKQPRNETQNTLKKTEGRAL